MVRVVGPGVGNVVEHIVCVHLESLSDRHQTFRSAKWTKTYHNELLETKKVLPVEFFRRTSRKSKTRMTNQDTPVASFRLRNRNMRRAIGLNYDP